MVARVATFEGGSNDRIREIQEGRMADGSLGMPDGVQKVLVLGNGDASRMLITFFADRDAAAAAEERFEAMGDDFPEEIRGRRTSVEVYEVLFDQAV